MLSRIERFQNKVKHWKYYFLHRFVWKSHIMRIREMKMGEYYEIEEKMFLSLTQLFEEYVEKQLVPTFLNIDQAETLLILDQYNKDAYLKYKEYLDSPFYDRWFRRNHWNQKLPWITLAFEISWVQNILNDNADDVSASERKWSEDRLTLYKKFLAIYTRIQIRKSRKDAFSGEYNGPEYIDDKGNTTNKFLSTTGCFLNRLHPEYAEYLDRCALKDEEYKDDDDNLMKEIVTIRYNLWT